VLILGPLPQQPAPCLLEKGSLNLQRPKNQWQPCDNTMFEAFAQERYDHHLQHRSYATNHLSSPQYRLPLLAERVAPRSLKSSPTGLDPTVERHSTWSWLLHHPLAHDIAQPRPFHNGYSRDAKEERSKDAPVSITRFAPVSRRPQMARSIRSRCDFSANRHKG
jgi:hypothetical protein